jgi:FG-GAP repeat
VSADGQTAVIGAPSDNGNIGAAWVFARSGDTCTQRGTKLTAPNDNDEGNFGASVAVSADGRTAVIGGPFDNNFAGAACVFTRSGSTWTPQGAKLTPADERGSGDFGKSVSLSADGSTALIGGDYDNSHAGAAWVFTRSGSTWSQQGAKLTPADESGDGLFGGSV